MMISHRHKALGEFYEIHLLELKEKYPGIKLEHLNEALTDFIELGRLERDFYRKLKEGTPLEYLTSKKYFYDGNIFVDGRVLIPRSETEILVEDSINYLKNIKSPLNLCEIGIGSGAIFLTISKHLEQKLNWTLTDISAGAIEVAKWNEYLFTNVLGDHEFNYTKTDRLDGVDQKFDFIVSNPPYIKEVADSEGVHKQVNKFEPHVALYLKDEEYQQWFSKLFNDVYKCLNNDGVFYMEGHEDHLGSLRELALSLNFSSAVVKKDYTQRDRFLYLTK